ncbi:response regulator, partial [Patescibacteria group bacterium]|nr:response regulator [Patescibacteria group bacterium]
MNESILYTINMQNNPPLILVVDDELDITRICKIKLERSGFRVITAANGAEAVEMAIKQHPDLILMDIKMPFMDGATAQKKLAENPNTKDIKVVFLSAFDNPAHMKSDQAFSREVGAEDYIKKGVDIDDLVNKV